MSSTTPNMSLVNPTVSSTLGPEWASLINAALELLDSHDHSSGKGVKVTPAGLNINAELDINSQNLSDANSYGLVNRTVADTSNLGSLQRLNGNLYWLSPANQAVQLTDGGNIVDTGGKLEVSIPDSYPATLGLADTSKVILVDTTSARTINLPAASLAQNYYYIKDANSNAQTQNITITPDGSDEIENANANYTLDWNDAAVGIISDGVSKWHIF